MDRRIIAGLASSLFILALLPLSFATLTSSPGLDFNTTPEIVSFNWTNSYSRNLTVGVNGSISSMEIAIQNASSTFFKNYSQPITEYTNPSAGFSSGTCGSGESSVIPIILTNTGGTLTTNATISGNQTSDFILNVSSVSSCAPGRYWGLLNTTNSTDTSEYTNTTAILDVPISSSNTLNTSTGLAEFKGILSANETEYHSYFFNVSQMNATTVLINLTWDDQDDEDVDLFLYNDTTLLAKSIKSGEQESLYHGYLSGNHVWELRLYGNSTSLINYTSGGKLLFSTLNATNNADDSTIDLLSLGSVNASNLNTTDITIRNEGLVNYTSLTQTSEIYREELSTVSSAGNYTFNVPDFATRIEVGVNWTGSGNYSLYLIHPNGTQVDSSSNKRVIANFTGSESEERVEFVPSATIGLDADGKWVINVTNHTVTEDFTIKKKIFYNATEWIDTNFTSTALNMTGLVGNITSYQFNLTTQNKTLSGLHEGNLIYTTNYGSVLKVPFQVNVTSPVLLVNDTYNKSTVTLNDNIGFNHTLTLNITVNNTGNTNMTFDQSSNSSFMNNTGNATNYLNYTYTEIDTLAAGSDTSLNITLTLDTTQTANDAGIYEGWIYLNDSDAHPYGGFNLTFKVNLTDDLDVYVREIDSSNGDEYINSSVENDVTVHTEVFYTNGTEIEDAILGNFSTVHLIEQNTSYRIPGSSGFALDEKENAASFFNTTSGWYELNATIPANSSMPGGYYDFYVTANASNGQTLAGTGINGTLIINSTGLKVAVVSEPSGGTLTVDEEGVLNVSVTNYGPLAATDVELNLTYDDDEVSVEAWDAGSTCSNDDVIAGGSIDFDLSSQGTCYLAWNVTGVASSDADMTLASVSSGNGVWYGNVAFDVDVSASSSSDSTSSSGAAGETTTDTHDITFEVYPETTEIVQGANKTVQIDIDNSGDFDEDDLSVYVSGVNSSWYVLPATFDLTQDQDKTISIKFTIPADAAVKAYPITYGVKNDDLDSSVSASLKILPSNETIDTLDERLSETTESVSDLENEINDILKDLTDENRNSTLEKMNTIKSKLAEAKAALDAGDYFTAASLMNEVDELMEELRTSLEIEESSVSFWGVFLIVLGVMGVVGIGGLVVYMVLPPKDGMSQAAVSGPPSQRNEQIKKTIENITERIKRIFRRKKKGYDPERGFSY